MSDASGAEESAKDGQPDVVAADLRESPATSADLDTPKKGAGMHIVHPSTQGITDTLPGSVRLRP
jgi:hypothetical protein